MDGPATQTDAAFPCLACGAMSLESDAAVLLNQLCLVCGWEHDADGHRLPDERVAPNYVSLNRHKQVVRDFGSDIARQVNRVMGLSLDDVSVTPCTSSSRHRGPRVALVWTFHAEASRFPSGVWTSKSQAEQWIAEVSASGLLSAYALNESAWDANVRLGALKAESPARHTAEFKRKFTTPIDHFHYHDGVRS